MALTAGAAVLSVTGLVGSTYVKSPAERRAAAAPPTPTVLTAPVERRVLADTVVVRGTVVTERRIEVTPVVSDVGAQVVTQVRARTGATVRAGQVLLAVSGRPLVVLPGRTPGYRDLKPGDSGEDVTQLQHALKGLGHYRGGDRAGYFGASTKSAVRRLYRSIGYDVPDTGGRGGAADRPALDAARSAIESAEHELRTAVRDAAGQDAVDIARRRFERAKAAETELIAHTGPMLPLAEAVFVPAFPARVIDMKAEVGRKIEEPLLTLGAGNLSIEAKLPPDQATLVQPGMGAIVASEITGDETAAKVTTVGEPVVDSTGGAAPHCVVLLQSLRRLPSSWADLDVRVTVTSAKSARKVLVVPASAIFAGADGTSAVLVQPAAGVPVRTEVRAGASAGGFVEVTPLHQARLREGDVVVVGTGA
ncbi:peptidoglycan-binding protein [Micromonospora sp.]|uniref:peptidoglycan-binding protein n=1 Tax=unclassified Micromonospora TaxID=2617518 RepID=UPI003B3BBB7D